MRSRLIRLTAIALAAVTSLAACGSSKDDAATSPSGKKLETVVVGATPVPHAKILQFVKDNLAEKAGLNIVIKEFTDYVQPNVALADGDIDANYFQHLPYLENEIKEKGYKFDHGAGIHIEPFGVYSTTIKNIKDVPNGAKVAITNDPSNQARALKLLAQAGLITLAKGDKSTIYDLASNPKNLVFTEVDPASIPRVLSDYDLGIINGNFALQNNLVPTRDALLLESGADNPYSNVLVWAKDGKNLDAVKKLDKLLHSPEVADFIKKTWPNGEVIPAF